MQEGWTDQNELKTRIVLFVEVTRGGKLAQMLRELGIEQKLLKGLGGAKGSSIKHGSLGRPAMW